MFSVASRLLASRLTSHLYDKSATVSLLSGDTASRLTFPQQSQLSFQTRSSSSVACPLLKKCVFFFYSSCWFPPWTKNNTITKWRVGHVCDVGSSCSVMNHVMCFCSLTLLIWVFFIIVIVFSRCNQFKSTMVQPDLTHTWHCMPYNTNAYITKLLINTMCSMSLCSRGLHAQRHSVSEL